MRGRRPRPASSSSSTPCRPRLPAGDGTYDLVLLALVADHLADLDVAMRELYRVLRVGGTMIFTVLHPAMNMLGLTARFADPRTGEEVRVAAFEHTYADYIMSIAPRRLHDRGDRSNAAPTPSW